jgi:hypothetical protein
MVRNPLWLLGVYAQVGQKSFLKMSTNSGKKNLSVHPDILCSLTKFCKKNIFFVTCVKKTIFYATKLLFT